MTHSFNRLAALAVAAFLVGHGCTGQAPTSDAPRGVLHETAANDRGEPKKGFVGNIDRLTVANENYREVVYTGKHMQLVLMALEPGEAIGEEVHEGVDQFFRIEAGEGEIVIDGVTHRVAEDSAMLVPAGARHLVRNTGKEPLKFYTLYGPPEHRRDVVHRTQAEAERSPGHFDGKTSEEGAPDRAGRP